ncbi:Membrane bound FAD containing D-sorbitol dehydrogenase [Kushneria avicenniae]|uniref:Membrane bound FAD containing D-sorbitol dehydrogenase n=1 Tax=Kushneria avicenniae TaxID=402385 RepID=A0A1I1JZ47_9GAMM|nr:sugar dehydrogenase complex small subunit [Kushneria avicenniae]SFC53531.1 Membrane bound FAD containing D-sorbitol dehydrogenase [Kushneria avicenniae]
MTQFSRRRVLKVAGAFALTGVAGQTLFLSSARASSEATQNTLDRFMGVSSALTAREDLDGDLARALLHAHLLTDQDFPEALSRLEALLKAQPALLSSSRLAFAEDQSAQEATARAMLSGWYTGVVGEGDQALYVSFVNTLANVAVSDVLVPPSFSYGPCGSWQAPPRPLQE